MGIALHPDKSRGMHQQLCAHGVRVRVRVRVRVSVCVLCVMCNENGIEEHVRVRVCVLCVMCNDNGIEEHGPGRYTSLH